MQARLLLLVTAALCTAVAADSQSTDSCADLTKLKVDGVEITRSAIIPAGATVPPLAAPKDAAGKPEIENFLTDGHRKLFMGALMTRCDAKGGVAEGMIFDPLGCDFDPAVLSCKAVRTEGGVAREKIAAIKRAFAGPKNAHGTQVYPGFLYDAGIAGGGPIPGLLALHANGLFGPYTTAIEIDVDTEALHASDPLVEPAFTNLSTFSANGGKLLFFHGDSDPWFSPLGTLEYYKSLAAANPGAEK